VTASRQQHLLLDSYPLIVLPELAVKIGLNESIILQQVHYWVNINERAGKNYEDGYTWTYQSLEQWRQQFPFWGERTIRRTLNSLKKLGLLVTSNYNKTKFDHTTWYRIDYHNVSEIAKKTSKLRCGQIGHIQEDKLATSFTRDYKETEGDGLTDPPSVVRKPDNGEDRNGSELSYDLIQAEREQEMYQAVDRVYPPGGEPPWFTAPHQKGSMEPVKVGRGEEYIASKRFAASRL